MRKMWSGCHRGEEKEFSTQVETSWKLSGVERRKVRWRGVGGGLYIRGGGQLAARINAGGRRAQKNARKAAAS